MSEEGKVALGCGCVMFSDTGFPFASCKSHDRRTRAVKVAAALQDLGNWLDEAGRAAESVAHAGGGGFAHGGLAPNLKAAGVAAVKAAKAMIE